MYQPNEEIANRIYAMLQEYFKSDKYVKLSTKKAKLAEQLKLIKPEDLYLEDLECDWGRIIGYYSAVGVSNDGEKYTLHLTGDCCSDILIFDPGNNPVNTILYKLDAVKSSDNKMRVRVIKESEAQKYAKKLAEEVSSTELRRRGYTAKRFEFQLTDFRIEREKPVKMFLAPVYAKLKDDAGSDKYVAIGYYDTKDNYSSIKIDEWTLPKIPQELSGSGAKGKKKGLLVFGVVAGIAAIIAIMKFIGCF